MANPGKEKFMRFPSNSIPQNTNTDDMEITIRDCVNSRLNNCFQLQPAIFMMLYSLVRLKNEPMRK